MISCSGRAAREKPDRGRGCGPDPRGAGRGNPAAPGSAPRLRTRRGAAPPARPGPASLRSASLRAVASPVRSAPGPGAFPESCEAGTGFWFFPRLRFGRSPGRTPRAPLLGEIWARGPRGGGGWRGKAAREDDVLELFWGVIGVSGVVGCCSRRRQCNPRVEGRTRLPAGPHSAPLLLSLLQRR